MKVNAQDFAARVVLNGETETEYESRSGYSLIQFTFDSSDKNHPIQMNTDYTWYTPKDLRQLAKVLKALADAADQHFNPVGV